MGIFKINDTGRYQRQDAVLVYITQGAAEEKCRAMNAAGRQYMVIWLWGLAE